MFGCFLIIVYYKIFFKSFEVVYFIVEWKEIFWILLLWKIFLLEFEVVSENCFNVGYYLYFGIV